MPRMLHIEPCEPDIEQEATLARSSRRVKGRPLPSKVEDCLHALDIAGKDAVMIPSREAMASTPYIQTQTWTTLKRKKINI